MLLIPYCGMAAMLMRTPMRNPIALVQNEEYRTQNKRGCGDIR